MAKKKAPSFFRTTISISTDLKRRMDKAGSGVNWSAVAAEAFESKLAEIAAKKEVKDMDDVIQRLRGSSAVARQASYQKGYLAGQKWAKEAAEADDLRQLHEEWGRAGRRAFDVLKGTDDSVSPSDVLARMIQPDADPYWVERFWAQFGPPRLTSRPPFCMGFLRGALAIWGKVREVL